MDLEFPGFAELTEIGRGGMSAVYRARDVALDRWVALKVLAAELAVDPGFRARFIAESKTVAGLDHPHIIPVYAAGQISDRLYLAMRYVPGADLGRLISHAGPLTLDRTAALITQVAGALDAAHAAGLVHRDVKPANILVEDRPGGSHCWLSDFGITKRLSAAPSEITATGALLGTPEYAAPEQIRSARVDARTDVYGLGCVVYKCLTGSSPFPRDSYTAVLAAHLTEPPPAPSAARPGLPAAVDVVIATALAKDPDDRYKTCAALAEALRHIADRAGAEPTSPTGAKVVAERRPRRSRLLVTLGLVVIALAVAALAVTSRAPAPSRGDPVLLAPSAVTATSTAPSGVDSASRAVTYQPNHVTDHDLATAWRTPGDGIGQQVRLEFPQPVRVGRIGLVPGYAKIDPVDGTNRFTQNRTVASVRYLFDDGTAVTAVFEPRPDLQFTQVDAVTRTVIVEIVATTAPGGRDFTPISEIEVYGWPA